MPLLVHDVEKHEEIEIDAREMSGVQHGSEFISLASCPFAVNTSRPDRLQSGAKNKEMIMRWLPLTPTWAAMPLIAALVANGFAEPARPESGIPDEARAVVAFWRTAGPALWFAKDDAFYACLERESFEVAADRYACQTND